MKNSVRFFSRISAVLLAVAAMVSCAQEEELIDNTCVGPTTNSRGETTFTINVPGSPTVSTRGITEKSAADNAIYDLIFLLFDTDSKEFVDYAIPTEMIAPEDDGNPTTNENVYTVKVKLPVDTYQALVVANWGRYKDVGPVVYMDNIGKDALSGKTLDEVIAGITTDDGEVLFRHDGFEFGKGNFAQQHGFFLMGSEPFEENARSFDLIRSLAKINVGVAENATDGSDGVTQFELLEIRLLNAARQARVFPSLSDDADGMNLPDPVKTIGMSGSVYLQENGQITDNACIDEIFLPETPKPANIKDGAQMNTNDAWKDAVALLIRAKVNATTERWYRLNLQTGSGNSKTHVDIRRNFRYQVNITGVKGFGHANAEDALESLPNDLEVNLKVIDDDLTNIVYNDQYYLATNVLNEFKSWESIKEDGYHLEQNLKIFTDYPGGWEVEKVEYADNDTGADWIKTVFPTNAVLTPTTPYAQEVAVETNHGPTKPRTATLTITAGPLSLTMTVKQKPGGILASPGVIGIGMESGKLTLSGSREYGGTPIETDSEFGPLADETVYVTHFKWGSLIAVSSANNGRFSSSEIMAAPDEYTYDGKTGLAAIKARVDAAGSPAPSGSHVGWNAVPYNSTASDGWPVTSDQYILGKGDPCIYYSEFLGEGWRLPTSGVPNYWQDGAFGTTFTEKRWDNNAPEGTTWVDHSVNPYLNIPVNGAVAGDGNGGQDWSMFLPAAEYRSTDGDIYTWRVGNYWSSTNHKDSFGDRGHSLHFDSAELNPQALYNPAIAFSIRCVKKQPTLTIEPNEVTLSHEGAAMTVQLTSNAEWEVDPSTIPDWCELLPLSGSGNTPITITAQSTTSTRSETITFRTKDGSISRTLTVKQELSGKLSATDISFSHYGGIANSGVTITGAAENWRVQSQGRATWFTAIRLNSTTVRIECNKNTSMSSRSPSIVTLIDDLTGATCNFSVKQEGLPEIEWITGGNSYYLKIYGTTPEPNYHAVDFIFNNPDFANGRWEAVDKTGFGLTLSQTSGTNPYPYTNKRISFEILSVGNDWLGPYHRTGNIMIYIYDRQDEIIKSVQMRVDQLPR